MAFDQIETTVNLTQPDSIRLYWIGSTVHVPFQNGNDPIDVEVPQEVPSELALANLASKLTTLKIMRVHPDQDKVLQAYLGSSWSHLGSTFSSSAHLGGSFAPSGDNFGSILVPFRVHLGPIPAPQTIPGQNNC